MSGKVEFRSFYLQKMKKDIRLPVFLEEGNSVSSLVPEDELMKDA